MGEHAHLEEVLSALDAGDVSVLRSLLDAHPDLPSNIVEGKNR
ncbi:MAG: hypothetical protein OSA81_01785 [Longimicrobiales bacterium]|nr:hypothetical protein [Longimicrobiales bacterium]